LYRFWLLIINRIKDFENFFFNFFEKYFANFKLSHTFATHFQRGMTDEKDQILGA